MGLAGVKRIAPTNSGGGLRCANPPYELRPNNTTGNSRFFGDPKTAAFKALGLN
jgi:hypothetical protein